MSFDFDRLATLLHLKEKLLGHPQMAAAMQHVDVELANIAAEATKVELPPRVPTRQQEEATEQAAAAAKAQEEANERAEQAKVTEEEAAARRARDDEQAKAPSPSRVPPPNGGVSLTDRRID